MPGGIMKQTVVPAYHPFRSAEARERYVAAVGALAEAWPLTSKTRIVETEYGQTLVRIDGPDDGPPLVFPPGAWSHSLHWSPAMIAALSETYRTYRIDEMGNLGLSVPARILTGTADRMAWLDGLFDALGLTGPVSFLGISRGAWLAAEYCLHAPERVAKVVWMSPGLVVQRASLRNAGGGPRALAVFANPTPGSVGALMRWLMPEWERNDGESFNDYVSHMALGLQCYAKIPSIGGPRVFSDAELAGITMPVLYMAGEGEKLLSVKAAVARLAWVAPRIEVSVSVGAGHDISSGDEDATIERIRAFLDA